MNPISQSIKNSEKRFKEETKELLKDWAKYIWGVSPWNLEDRLGRVEIEVNKVSSSFRQSQIKLLEVIFARINKELNKYSHPINEGGLDAEGFFDAMQDYEDELHDTILGLKKKK